VAQKFKPATCRDAMAAALERPSAYATTAIAFDDKPTADPNLSTIMTHANANICWIITNVSNPSISIKLPNADCHPVSLSPMNFFFKRISLNPVDRTNAAYHAS
jgi:hypothetical protein